MKKKILLLIFIFAIVVGMCNIDGKEVKAEAQNCETYTNYYLFLAAYDISTINNLIGSNESVDRTNRKDFNLGVPDDATNKSEGILDVSLTSVDSSNEMSLRTFYNYFGDSEDNVAFSDDDGITNYIRAITWYDATGNTPSTTFSSLPSTYSEFENRIPKNLELPKITLTTNSNVASGIITRTWYKDDISHITDGKVFSPAVYYIQYDLCGDAEYKTIAHYIDSSTNKEIDSDVIDSGLLDGDTYEEYSCPASVKDISGVKYLLDSGYNSTFKSGTINGKDVDFNCYYTKEDSKATLTINFGTNSDCSEGNNIRKSETADYVVGSNIKYTIPSISGYEFSNIGSNSINANINSSNQLTFNMPNKNTTICLVYIKNAQTGSAWIYLTWIIGIIALSYSVWYFVKYYKNQNNEI